MKSPVNATVATGQLAPFGRGRQSLKESVWYSGWLLTFLATGEDTQGRFSLIEGVARKGNVPPAHIHHREDETFYIVEGEMTATVGGQKIKGTSGSVIFAPRGIVHSFEINSEQMRMLVLLTPAGLEGYFKECSVPAPAMTMPPPAEVPYSDMQKLLDVGTKYGLEWVLPSR
jgi:quercetin dioxygenase-like cupin family protein